MSFFREPPENRRVKLQKDILLLIKAFSRQPLEISDKLELDWLFLNRFSRLNVELDESEFFEID